MREKKSPKPKQEKKGPKKGTNKPKQETKPTASTQEDKNQPTKEEIEAIKEDMLAHGLLNPYALILYNYMRISSYETNIQVVLSMRESLMKIAKINEIILDELKEDN